MGRGKYVYVMSCDHSSIQDTTRIYWPSSPSNGVLVDDKDTQMFIQRWGDVANPKFGDYHRYTPCLHLTTPHHSMSPPHHTSPHLTTPCLHLTTPHHTSPHLTTPCLHLTTPCLLHTHRYDYNDFCLDVSKFPPARFVSEFGFQSYPSSTSMKNISQSVVSNTANVILYWATCVAHEFVCPLIFARTGLTTLPSWSIATTTQQATSRWRTLLQ